jgi:hypothetical protein
MNTNKYLHQFRAKVWLYPGQNAAWHFVNVPKKLSKEIREKFGGLARGWGSLPVTANIGKTKWKTSIFPDKKTGTYLLPLKATIRQKEHIAVGITLRCSLEIIT